MITEKHLLFNYFSLYPNDSITLAQLQKNLSNVYDTLVREKLKVNVSFKGHPKTPYSPEISSKLSDLIGAEFLTFEEEKFIVNGSPNNNHFNNCLANVNKDLSKKELESLEKALRDLD